MPRCVRGCLDGSRPPARWRWRAARGVGRCRRFCVELVRELLVLVLEAVQLALQRFHAPLEALGVEVSVLEGVEVAVGRALGALDLGESEIRIRNVGLISPRSIAPT